jgi:enterochelin esterase-like enzyme
VRSTALAASRAVTTYLPPADLAPGGPVRGCVLADGQAVEHYAPVLEHAMRSGVVPPTVVVGVHTVIDAPPTWPDTRAQEYVPGHNRRRFAAHLRFVADEVLAWARRELEVEPATWTAAGFSSGAVWAIAAAQRRAEVFPRVVALSAGVAPQRISASARAARVRHYLAAGVLEPAFLRATRAWAQRLRRAGLDVRLDEIGGGHDNLWWREQLVTGLAHLENTSARSS